MRQLSFPADSFDIVISNFVIHNLKDAEDRENAIHEMWRVLQPNGRLVISDVSKTSKYIQVLKSLSNQIEVKSFFYTFPFSTAIIVQKEI